MMPTEPTRTARIEARISPEALAGGAARTERLTARLGEYLDLFYIMRNYAAIFDSAARRDATSKRGRVPSRLNFV
jgi:hypothetical protein